MIRGGSGQRFGALAFSLAALSELVFVVAYLSGVVSSWAFLAQHVAASIFVLTILIKELDRSEELGRATIAGLAMVFGGPFGAVGAAILMLSTSRSTLAPDFEAAWRDLLSGRQNDDASDALFDEICDRRTVSCASGLPVPLEPILRAGSFLERQRAVGAIAARYDAGFRSLLESALKNPSPPVRVQAAAVLTRLRNQARSRYQASLADVRDATLDARSAIPAIRDLVDLLSGDLLRGQQRAPAYIAVDAAFDRLASDAEGNQAAIIKRCRFLVGAHFHDRAGALLDTLVPKDITT